MTSPFHLAQVNIGRIRGPIDGPLMAGFVARLEDVNALADRAPGFVWRLQTEAGNATALRPYADERVLLNMSVWLTPEQLRDYVFSGEHAAVMRQRKAWFEKFESAYTTLWWVRAGHIPPISEAVERLEYLEAHGPSPQAFTFARLYPAPNSGGAAPLIDFADPCPAV